MTQFLFRDREAGFEGPVALSYPWRDEPKETLSLVTLRINTVQRTLDIPLVEPDKL